MFKESFLFKNIKEIKNNNYLFLLLSFIREKKLTNEFIDFCNIHSGTLNRWISQKKVPLNYIIDFFYFLFKNMDILGFQKEEKEKIKKYYNDVIKLLNEKEKDQYFTKPKIAKYILNKSKNILKNNGINIDDYFYIEPSTGEGSFFNLLPKNKTIGIDLQPRLKGIIQDNYLNWKPKNSNKKYIVISNPPFGLRGNLALRFINHSEFADIVIFILPPLFNSDGKGTPKNRVKYHKLIYSENLPINSFIYPNKKEVNVNTIFQIWIKKDSFPTINESTKNINVDDLIKIYSLSNGKHSSQKRNIKMIDKCDLYLPSTCFDGMESYDNFNSLPNKRGYGIVIVDKKNKNKIKKYLTNLDWKKYSFYSTNSAINLRTSLIKEAIYNWKTNKIL